MHNRTEHTVNIGGEIIPLRYEMQDWAVAGKKLKLKFYPFMATEFWRPFIERAELEKSARAAGLELNPAEADDFIYESMVLLFVGIQSAKPNWTWNYLGDVVTWDKATETLAIVGEAVKDFFQRMGMLPKSEETTEPPPPMPPPVLTPGNDSAPTVESN